MKNQEQINQVTPTQFTQELVARNLLSLDSAQLVAEHFANRDNYKFDAVEHILVGDEYGGLHHGQTVVELDLMGRTIASRLTPSSLSFEEFLAMPNAASQRNKRVRKQKLKDNGVFSSGEVAIDLGGIVVEKEQGSSMFPSEWTAGTVLESIIQSKIHPDKVVEKDENIIYEARVNNVTISTVTNKSNGKIISAYPKSSTS